MRPVGSSRNAFQRVCVTTGRAIAKIKTPAHRTRCRTCSNLDEESFELPHTLDAAEADEAIATLKNSVAELQAFIVRLETARESVAALPEPRSGMTDNLDIPSFLDRRAAQR